MRKITYLEALLLKEIQESNAEVYTNREPKDVYVNNRAADNELLPILDKLVTLNLLNVRPNQTFTLYTINDEGRFEIQSFFGAESVSRINVSHEREGQ